MPLTSPPPRVKGCSAAMFSTSANKLALPDKNSYACPRTYVFCAAVSFGLCEMLTNVLLHLTAHAEGSQLYSQSLHLHLQIHFQIPLHHEPERPWHCLLPLPSHTGQSCSPSYRGLSVCSVEYSAQMSSVYMCLTYYFCAAGGRHCSTGILCPHQTPADKNLVALGERYASFLKYCAISLHHDQGQLHI